MIHKIIFNNPKKSLQNKALFVDRDGIINKNPNKHDYVKKMEEFEFNKEIFKSDELEENSIII